MHGSAKSYHILHVGLERSQNENAFVFKNLFFGESESKNMTSFPVDFQTSDL